MSLLDNPRIDRVLNDPTVLRKQKVKIISGWSNPGGSTVANINLCNLFNDNGIECEFWGPHNWHLDKCNGKKYGQPITRYIEFNKNDIVISHFCLLAIEVKKHIFSCHETELFPIYKFKDLSLWNAIHFVSEKQKNWHMNQIESKKKPTSIVIPNIISDLQPASYPDKKIAGVIGSVDRNKQTHISIQRALDDGYKVLVCGDITDNDYFQEHCKQYTKNENVYFIGHFEDKQQMYDSVQAVYHSSKSETFNYIKAECRKTGVVYRGLDSAESNAEYWENEKILKAWKGLLEL